MNLEIDTIETYLRHALGQMVQVADRLGDDLLNERPVGDETNAVGALIVHSCEVTSFWLGHVAGGLPTERDRDREFSRRTTVGEVRAMVERTLAGTRADLERMADGDPEADPVLRQFLPGGDESDDSLVLHVIEELFQHLGHMEITADVLLAR
ncbi:MAG: DUF664 domain-containing protein [Acidimicrobiales bacterium]